MFGMEDKTKLSMLAMILLTALEIAAMCFGIDGYLFGIIVAAISALAGYEIKALTNTKSK